MGALIYNLVDTMPKKKMEVEASPQSGTAFATVVRESIPILPANRRHSILWCFCEFCGRQTEYAVASEAVSVYERLGNESGSAKAVPRTDAMRVKARKVADDLVVQYEQAMTGCYDPDAQGKLLDAFCDRGQMLGDFSVDSFRDQVERRALNFIWFQHGDMYGAVRLPDPQNGAQRPSKLYCDLHQPGRSEATRRAYQRDRRFVAEYEEIVRVLWSRHAGDLRQWHIDDHALVRHAAYHVVRLLKAPTRILDEYPDLKVTATTQSREKSIEDYYEKARTSHNRLRQMREPTEWIDDLQERGVTNQSELARHLGVERQAVSAALKRRAKGRAPATD